MVVANSNDTLIDIPSNFCDLAMMDQETSSSAQWFRVIIPLVSVIGIVGNAFNICFLRRKRLRLKVDDVIGHSANNAMMSLAASDMLFCFSILPHTFIQSRGYCVDMRQMYVMLYRVYGVAFINLFLMTGSVLVCITANMRYVAVASPIGAKNHLLLRNNGQALLLCIIACVLLTLPQFMHFNYYVEDLSHCGMSDIVLCVYYRFDEPILVWIQRYSERHLFRLANMKLNWRTNFSFDINVFT